jgi:TonB family protein
MRIVPVFRLVNPALLLGGVLLGTQAHAQEDLRMGNVAVHLQADPVRRTDLSFATLWPDGDAAAGAVLWACGGDTAGLSVGVDLADTTREGSTTARLVWRFDEDAPDTTVLYVDPSVGWWLLTAADAGAVMARARRAQSLVVEVPADPGSRAAAEYRYTLAGVDSALSRMRCTGTPRLAGRRMGMATLQRLIEIAPDSASKPEVGVLDDVELANTAAMGRWLARNYPRAGWEGGVSAQVVVRFRVLEDGTADSASVQVLSSTNDTFIPTAVGAVQCMRFRPARVNGRPVKVWTQVPFDFSPPEDAPTGSGCEPEPGATAPSRRGRPRSP